jgi:1,4-alpha-glucan branching enzyme
MVTNELDGSLTFRVYLPHAQSVELLSDFTDWKKGTLALKRDPLPKNVGWWTVNCKVCDGDHAFAYLVDDQWWLPDYAAHGVRRNDRGQWTSLLFVKPLPTLSDEMTDRPEVGAASAGSFLGDQELPFVPRTVSHRRLRLARLAAEHPHAG